jgi:CTP:molybdopterin cytidylyltransferase MocA
MPRKPFSCFHARCVVAQADTKEIHGVRICAVKLIPQSKLALAGLSVSITEHPNWSNGLGSSIAVGVKHAANIAADLEVVILLTCDQPFVNAAALRQLFNRTWKLGSQSSHRLTQRLLGFRRIFSGLGSAAAAVKAKATNEMAARL